jgi:sugar phosphate isomerase/epimerase
MPSPNGPPISATRACRSRLGTPRCHRSEEGRGIKGYCDDVAGKARENGVEVTELSTHLQGQLVAVHPAYDEAFDGFAAPEVRGNPKARQEWAVEQVKMALTASKHLGLDAMASFPARSPGPSSIPGRSGRPVSSRLPSTNWRNAGSRSSTMRG